MQCLSLLHPVEQAVYNRPQPADKTRSKEGKDTVEAYQLAQRLQSMVCFLLPMLPCCMFFLLHQNIQHREELFNFPFEARSSQGISPLVQFAVSLERPMVQLSLWVDIQMMVMHCCWWWWSVKHPPGVSLYSLKPSLMIFHDLVIYLILWYSRMFVLFWK